MSSQAEEIQFALAGAGAGNDVDNAAAQRIINREKYIYQVAGTRERLDTPTPGGVCSHVKAP
jgi:hypothetical protein